MLTTKLHIPKLIRQKVKNKVEQEHTALGERKQDQSVLPGVVSMRLGRR